MSTRWEGVDREGPWKIEVDNDTFNVEDGPVVCLYVENGERGPEQESGLVGLSPAEAREIAVRLLAVAEACEGYRAQLQAESADQ